MDEELLYSEYWNLNIVSYLDWWERVPKHLSKRQSDIATFTSEARTRRVFSIDLTTWTRGSILMGFLFSGRERKGDEWIHE